MRIDGAQFERVVAEQRRMVFSIAVHALRDRALAEEITQDVFLALYQHHDQIESDEHLIYWLRRVTTRRCIDQIRKRRWRQWLPLGEREEAESAVASAPRGDPLLSGRLQRLVHGLPAVARLALVLRYQEDLDPAEIATALGVTENAVKNHLRRALTHLKLRLERPDVGGPRGPGTGFARNQRRNPASGARACAATGPESEPGNLEHP